MTSKQSRPCRSVGRVLAVVLGLTSLATMTSAARAETETVVPTVVPYQPSAVPSFAAPGAPYPLYAQAAPSTVRTRQWYGYQIMGTDVASIAVMFTGAAAPVGGFGLFIAPPVIHGVHHNVTMAIVSPVMRVGLPLVGGLIGASAESCSHTQEDDWCGFGGAIAGVGLGLLTAMILDYSLAWESLDASPPSAESVRSPEPPRRPSHISLTTAGVAPSANGASLVLGGRF
jgi:hypothetical protein